MQAAISSGILNQVLQEFLQALQNDYGRIEQLAKGLFYYLAGIQIVVSVIWMLFKSDPMETFVKTLQIVFTISVFYTLVLFGGQWMPEIINGFISIGASASHVTSLTPSSVLGQGLSIGFAILDNFNHWGWVTHPFGSLLACAILLAIIILYAFLSAEMAIILIKSYVLISLSGLMFAFGANEFVRPMAINYFKSVIGIGLQLLTFYLLMGVGVQIGQSWAVLIGQAASNHALQPFLVVMAAVIFFYLIIKNVPPFIAGLSGVGGFRSYGEAAVGTAMMAGGMGAKLAMGAASAAVSGAQALGQVGKAGLQAGQMMGQALAGGSSKGGALGKGLSHLAGAVGGAIKDSVMQSGGGKSFGQQVNTHLAARRAQMSAKTSQTSAPQNSAKANQVQNSD